jgi:hypothetical protein
MDAAEGVGEPATPRFLASSAGREASSTAAAALLVLALALAAAASLTVARSVAPVRPRTAARTLERGEEGQRRDRRRRCRRGH